MAVAFFLPLSLNLSSIFLSAGAALWLAKILLLRQVDFRKTPFDRVIALLVIISAASIAMSPDRDFSYYNYYHLMGRYVLIYYLVVNHIHSTEQLKRLVRTLLASAALVTFYGFYQYIFGIDISSFEWVDGQQFPDLKVRVFSTLENPNLLAGFLVIIMSLAAGLGFYEQRGKTRLILFSLVFILGACLALTYCRGAWLSIVAVVAVCGIMHSRKLFWILLIIPLIAFGFHDAIGERMASILNPTDTSAALRLALWESTWAMIVDNPLTGIGWGAYWLVYPQYDFFINDAGIRIYHAHNTYLHVAAEIGIPGLLAFLAFAGNHIKTAVSNFKHTADPWLAGLMLGIIAAMAGLAVAGLTDHILFNVQMSMLFWLLNSIVIVVWLELQQKQEYY